MSVTLTALAAAEIKRVIEEQALGAKTMLRVAVQGGGCSGFNYALGFDEEIEEDDIVTEQHGLKVAVDPRSASVLTGTTIDFKSDINHRGFTFDNPFAAKSCGCGSSFSPRDDIPPPPSGGCGSCPSGGCG